MDDGTGHGRRFGLRQTAPRQTGPGQTRLWQTRLWWTGPRGRGTRRAGALAAGLAATALLAAACGGGASPPASAAETNYQKMLSYSQCMRANGEPGFPDPQPNGNLLLNPSDHLNGALMNHANKICGHLQPKMKPMTAAQQRQVTAEALKFVACMRQHGIPNMPDPIVNAQGIELRIGGPGHSGPPPNSPVLRAAQQTCHKFLPGSLP
jgi:hypothetical protein